MYYTLVRRPGVCMYVSLSAYHVHGYIGHYQDDYHCH